MKPHVLIVSWWYPPLRGGGVYRPLNFSRLLREHGFRVSVLTAAPAERHGTDDSLAERIPDDVRVVRVPHFDPFVLYGRLRGLLPRRRRAAAPAASRASANSAAATPAAPRAPGFKDWLSERFTLPDRWITWVGPAARAAHRAFQDDPPDLIFSTSPPHSLHFIAERLKKRWGCPWVLDFRDPWVGNPFRAYSLDSLVEKDAALERRVLSQVDAVVANTPALESKLRQRFPELPGLRTITNGYDPEQVAAPEPIPPLDGPLELLHVGHLYGARSGRYLVQGLKVLAERSPDLARRLRVRLIGAIDNEAAYRAEVEAHGLSEVLDMPGSLPHAEALAVQRQAHGLLILGVEDEGAEVQVPGKLYEYFAARRPILSLSRSGGAIESVIQQAKFPHELGEVDDPDSIADALQRFLEGFEAGRLGDFDDEAIEQFRYDRLARRLSDCFREALGLEPADGDDASPSPRAAPLSRG